MESATVEELLSHDPEGGMRAARYAPLIMQTECKSLPAAVSKRWDMILPRLLRNEVDQSLFARALGGQLLIDCGAGKEYWMRKFAQDFHVGLLFEIDAAYQRTKVIDAGFPPIRIFFQKGDMLDVLARIPSRSANVTINGIDRTVITDDDYHKALADEIERVIHSDGIVFGFESGVERFLRDCPSLSEVRLASVTPELTAFRNHFVFSRIL